MESHDNKNQLRFKNALQKGTLVCYVPALTDNLKRKYAGKDIEAVVMVGNDDGEVLNTLMKESSRKRGKGSTTQPFTYKEGHNIVSHQTGKCYVDQVEVLTPLLPSWIMGRIPEA